MSELSDEEVSTIIKHLEANMGGLDEVLQKIKNRPGMYIGKSSVSDLFMFIVGYEFARGELGIESTEWEDDFHENFQTWLQRKCQVRTSNSWAKIIMLYCHEEKQGFEKFFKLLDEFQQRDKSLDGDWLDEMSKDNNSKIKETIITRD